MYANTTIVLLCVNFVLKAYYRNAVGGFVVYDVTDPKSFRNCQQWKKEIDDVVQLLNGDPIPIILIANKVLYK